jgi:hypothetical protein
VKDESDWKVRAVRLAFLDNLPVKYLRFYPFNTVLVLGGLSSFVMIGLFAYFFGTGYVQALKEQFISLDKNAGRCSEVQKPLTGTYAATDSGKWQGTKGFYFTNALYEVDFSSYSGSDNDFKEDLTEFYTNKIVPEGNKAMEQTLYTNLITQMSFADTFQSKLDGEEHTHIFSFTATPSMVFKKEFASGTICDSIDCCAEIPAISFDVFTSVQNLAYDYDAFTLACADIDMPEQLGYIDQYDNGHFQLDVDMNTVVTALALNMGVLKYPGILEVVTGIFPVDATGYTAVGVIDPRYEGMAPANCLIPDDGTPGSPICWVLITNSQDTDTDPVYALPLMSHYIEKDCECYIEYRDPYCNVLDLMTGLLYFKMDNWADTTYAYIYSLSLAYANDNAFKTLNNDAYDALLYASNFGFNSDKTQEEAFQFCTFDGNVSCNVIGINTYDEQEAYVTRDYYYIQEGNCEDIMTIGSNFTKLAKSPPTSLTEQYYKCFSYTESAFFGAAGIAFGNMSAFGPLLLLLLVPLMSTLLFKALGESVPESRYTDGEKDAAAKELAMHLLRIKDMNHEELDPNTTLYRLGRDLKELSEKYQEKERSVSLRRLTKASPFEANASASSASSAAPGV